MVLQQGLLLPVSGEPQPASVPGPKDATHVVVAHYAPFLPGCDPGHLLVAACPFAAAAGSPLLILYDASSAAPPNPRASRLTTDLETGLAVQVRGAALLLRGTPGAALPVGDWEQLDNAVFDELCEFFGQGLRPTPADVDRLVQRYKQGDFKYEQQAEEDEDANKDDGEELPGWG